MGDSVPDEERNGDVVYAEYMASPMPELEAELHTQLCDHANRLIWLRLHEVQPDIVDEAVARAMSHLNDFKGGSRFTTWFTRIVLNACNTHLRTKMRRRESPLVYEGAGADIESAVHATMEVERMMRSLPPDEREFLEWKLVGESEQDIAEKLGLTTEGVRSRWHRLKKKLNP
jgi:RNA polymerase sigma-70 factor (ECF subfamily)